MSKSKIVGIMALFAFAMGIVLVGDAGAGEKGKVVGREVYYSTTFHTLKVPDVEGHTMHLSEGKGIYFNEKFGPAVGIVTQLSDVIKGGAGTIQGYTHFTYPDGSTTTAKWKGERKGPGLGVAGGAGAKGTWSFIKGTGKFQGIQGQGTFESFVLAPGQWYADSEGEYTLP